MNFLCLVEIIKIGEGISIYLFLIDILYKTSQNI